tara:strand:+ start:520 stop:1770 length:1251 start_codon:yes stop_codon:yes gene_type:complete
MVDFNPIRDLRSPEADPFNVPAGQSTEEVEQIRLRLVLTKEKTEDIVKLIKRKGLVFKKDVEKIQELQRRLRKTIPRIPILRGDASVQGGSERQTTLRRGSLDLDFNRFRTTSTKPVRDPFPILDIIITAVLLRLGIRKQVKVQGGNKIIKFFRTKTNEPVKVKDFVKILEKEFAKTKNPAYKTLLQQLKLSQATKQKVLSQKEGFASSSKKFSKIKDVETTMFPKGRTLTLTRRNSNRLLRDLRNSAKKNNGLGAENFDEVAASTDLVLKEMKNSLFNKIGRLTPGSKEFNQTKRAIEKIDDTLIKVNDIRSDVVESRGLTTIGGGLAEKDVNKTFFEKITEKANKKAIKKSEKEGFIYESPFRNPKNINKKNAPQGNESPLINSLINDSMNNDIAMLNTDTSYRDIIIIKTDQA